MAAEIEWWGNLTGEDYIGAMPNPLPQIKRLSQKHGIPYYDGQQLSGDRGVLGVTDRGSATEGDGAH